MKTHLMAAAMFAAVAAPAAAYTTYLEPDTFWPEGREVQVEAAFASQFFTPHIALASEFQTIAPNGARITFDRVEVASQATTLQTDLPAGGTYRITTGERLGRVATMVAVDGQWRELAQGEAPPEGADTTTLQTVMVADVYITRGQVSREVVDAPIGRLAIRPVTHPNQVLAANGFEVEVLFDGQPMANSAIVLYGAGDADTDLDRYAVTNEAGRARFTFDAPGRYLIAARHRADAPPGSEAAVRSYTTTLTFEVLTELPEGYDVAAQQRRAEREAERRALRRQN
jgi:uncharacterized GH25 family protein